MYDIRLFISYRDITLAFPSTKYAEAAMNSIGVDPAFSDTKTKKTSIVRDMKVIQGDDASGIVHLDVKFSCNEDEVNSMRTCISSFVNNMSLICETMKEFGN